MNRRKSYAGIFFLAGIVLVLLGLWLFRPLEHSEKVALIHVEGVIVGGRGQGGLLGAAEWIW